MHAAFSRVQEATYRSPSPKGMGYSTYFSTYRDLVYIQRGREGLADRFFTVSWYSYYYYYYYYYNW